MSVQTVKVLHNRSSKSHTAYYKELNSKDLSFGRQVSMISQKDNHFLFLYQYIFYRNISLNISDLFLADASKTTTSYFCNLLTN